jgi:ribonuclease BN (tRNA processing enzyme)
MHPDHVGDLPRFIQLLYHSGRKEPVHLYVPDDTMEVMRKFLDICYLFKEKFWFELYIDPIPEFVDINRDVIVEAILNNHIAPMRDLCRQYVYLNRCECFSFLIKSNDKNILYSSDIDSVEDIREFLDNLGLLIIETSHIDLDSFLESMSDKNIDKILLTHIADDFEDKVSDAVSENKFDLNLQVARDNDVIEV